MSKSRLERMAMIAEVIAAIAVVISVIYLAQQISANNKLLKSQSYHNFLSMGQPMHAMIASDPEFAALIARCETAPYSVSETAWRQCESYYQMSVDIWEYLYYQNQDSIIPPPFWAGADKYFAEITTAGRGYQRFWSAWSQIYADPFGAHAENIIPDIAPPAELQTLDQGE